jgi:hypothetical protein
MEIKLLADEDVNVSGGLDVTIHNNGSSPTVTGPDKILGVFMAVFPKILPEVNSGNDLDGSGDINAGAPGVTFQPLL